MRNTHVEDVALLAAKIAVVVSERQGVVPTSRDVHAVARHALRMQRNASALRRRYENSERHAWAQTDAYESATIAYERKTAILLDHYQHLCGYEVDWSVDPKEAPVTVLFGGDKTLKIRLGKP